MFAAWSRKNACSGRASPAQIAANAKCADLEPNKVCDNCMRCLKFSDADYLAIEIDEIIEGEEEIEK